MVLSGAAREVFSLRARALVEGRQAILCQAAAADGHQEK